MIRRPFNIHPGDVVLLTIFTFIFYLTISFFWKRRRLYYYSAKIPGLTGLPIVGAIQLLLAGKNEAFNTMMTLAKSCPPLFKAWLGPNLYFSTSRPEDMEIILTKSLNKGQFYHLAEDYFHQSLLVSRLSIWKEHRKIINPTFNINVLNSMVPILVKYADRLKEAFENECGWKKEPEDLFPLFWKYTFESACETLGDVDAELLDGKADFLKGLFRYEEILTDRFFSFIFQNDYLWNFAALKREAAAISKKAQDFVEQIIRVNRASIDKHNEADDPLRKKRFLNYLLDLESSKKVSHDVLLEETPLMLFASSETTAIAMSSFLVILGLYPDVQERIFQELSSIEDKTFTIEDINRMDYLERAIKETLRLLPPIPFFLRALDKDVALDSHTLPAGSRIFFVVPFIHRKKELWPDPLKFDPDRFLPEEVEKRHRCAYVPFSYGPRNCIGLKYAMLSMKVMLATLIKEYKVVETVDYKNIEDIDNNFFLVSKAKKGYRVRLERRIRKEEQ